MEQAAARRAGGEAHAAEAVALEDVPIAPLYFFVSKHLVPPAVTGFESNALDRHPSRYFKKQ